MEEWECPTPLEPAGAKGNTSSLIVNRSCKNLECYMVLTEVEKTAIGSICFLAGPFTLLENALVLGVIATTVTLRQRPSYLFIGSLALADVFASCFFTTSFLDFHLFHHSDGPTAYLFKLGGVTMAFTGSVGSLLLTALDRYLCIHQASSYKVLLTRRRAMLSLLILWSTTLFLSFLPLMGWRCPTGLTPPCSCLFPYISRAYLACWTSFILVLLALILAAYALILWKAHRHESSMTSFHGAAGTGQARMRMDIRLARTFGLILLILVSCWLPALSFMLADVSVILTRAQQRAFAFCSTLCLLNSAINPLLYALRCRELRLAVLQSVRRMCQIVGCKESAEDLTPRLPSTEDNNCSVFTEAEGTRVRTTRLNSISEVVNNQQLNITK
ncbi:cannabinoid receptor 2 [Mugil cephalus]|uniref:cannabinoid receptor 2 n=1 Tax=Mugil cephalus TaxID=48193 RepID=UPI001FB64465|nr:cannabinoid receptor 2 [Mugil cephalus]XP_047453847.1 cannabinoid receptor 2 [Mugil cephalus]